MGRYSKVGKIAVIELIVLKKVLKYNTKAKAITLPDVLHPKSSLEFTLRGNGRQYEVSIEGDSVYLKALTDNLPTGQGPVVNLDFCFLTK
nr:MAG TPA: glycoside hydrolase family protein [Caudoviricetes sp.]